jgi:CheY-like chemotaxis protein
MWLETQVGVGTKIYFSLPLDVTPVSATDQGEPGDTKRWFNPYDEYEYRERTRRSKAPVPRVVPRVVLLEKGNTLARLLSRYLHDWEIVPVRDAGDALQVLSRSPARALVVNAPLLDRFPAPMDRLRTLPFGTPTVTCWAPGEQEAAERLGVVRYLVKPVTYDALLATLDELPVDVRTILLVDDEPEVLRLFARMLTLAQRGYRILQTTNGGRALHLLRERRPDVVLLDLIMPGMDGFQVLQAKSEDLSIRDVPVIILSSRDPSGAPIVSNTLTVTQAGGLSGHDLLDCICAISEILAPPARPDRGQPEASAG